MIVSFVALRDGFDSVVVLPQLKADWLDTANYGIAARDPMRKLDLPSSSIVCPTKCSVEPDSRYRQAVHPSCSAAVERRLFGCRRASGYALESVPQLGVAAGLLVRREVALEHAAIGTEGLDAGLDILAPCCGKFF
jgi:hypothetical protein